MKVSFTAVQRFKQPFESLEAGLYRGLQRAGAQRETPLQEHAS